MLQRHRFLPGHRNFEIRDVLGVRLIGSDDRKLVRPLGCVHDENPMVLRVDKDAGGNVPRPGNGENVRGRGELVIEPSESRVLLIELTDFCIA